MRTPTRRRRAPVRVARVLLSVAAVAVFWLLILLPLLLDRR
ncbi:hypothetical protein [Nonomuraea sp. WAC 01424]|nr:hypothetical protein [Nonomuraea sp. WAC 01424]